MPADKEERCEAERDGHHRHMDTIKILNMQYEDVGEIYEDEESCPFEDGDEEEYMIQDDNTGMDCIIIYSPFCRVTDKGLIFAEGTYCNWNEDEQEHMPDWSLTMIYEDVGDEDFDYMNYAYYEQDPPTTAIHNYTNYRDG